METGGLPPALVVVDAAGGAGQVAGWVDEVTVTIPPLFGAELKKPKSTKNN